MEGFRMTNLSHFWNFLQKTYFKGLPRSMIELYTLKLLTYHPNRSLLLISSRIAKTITNNSYRFEVASYNRSFIWMKPSCI